MIEKNIKSRITHKHDTEVNWQLAINFTPKQGEIIVYDIDENYSYERFKIGDGISNVNNLPFAGTKLELDTTLTIEGDAADAKAVGDAIAKINDDLENAGSIDIDLDGANEGEITPVNADTLGGYPASAFVKKDELEDLPGSGTSGAPNVGFSIVGGLEEPAEPIENMIWVVSDTPINRVFFGEISPKVLLMEGDVWIETGEKSAVPFYLNEMDGVYINEIQPLSAKQFVDGSLVEKDAKSYQNNEWVDWISYSYIFHEGVMHVNGNASQATYISGTIQNGYYVVNTKHGSTYAPYIYWNDVDLTDFNTLKFKITNVTSTLEKVICIGTGSIGNPASFGVVRSEFVNQVEEQIISLDVSNLTGNFKILFVMGGTASATIHDIWLEG